MRKTTTDVIHAIDYSVTKSLVNEAIVLAKITYKNPTNKQAQERETQE